MEPCKYCGGTGKLKLFTSEVDCDCVKQKPATEYEYAEGVISRPLEIMRDGKFTDEYMEELDRQIADGNKVFPTVITTSGTLPHIGVIVSGSGLIGDPGKPNFKPNGF